MTVITTIFNNKLKGDHIARDDQSSGAGASLVAFTLGDTPWGKRYQ